MAQLRHDLGQRMIQAAQLAAALHQEAQEIERNTQIGRQSSIGSAVLGLVKDDAPSAATARRISPSQRGAEPAQSPWTLAGENPAGSFVI